MKLITTEGSDDFASSASRIVQLAVRENPSLSLTLPTGSSPVGLYDVLGKAHRAGSFNLERARVFMLDEYCDLPSYPVGSFIDFLERHLGEVIFNDATEVQRLSPSSDPLSYDEAIERAGGIDLAIVGVGRNGHLGFNEPGDDPRARTHVVTLASDTVAANFPDVPPSQRPTRAITIGLADLRAARSVLMLVTGANKHGVADLLAAGIVDPMVPATHVLDHDDLTIVMAGELLREP
ncbi:MAG: hypothetical protein HKL86_01700 [Acidimicrobiaceae bacterium]|nr:hypothetical protein [Acidimicrobiaceae bacterium]